MMYEESLLQRWCKTFLDQRYCKVIKHHAANEAKRTKVQGGIEKALGMRKGWPDMEILTGGTVLFVEFKTPKGRQTPEQKQLQADLEEQGYTYLICRTREQFVDICHQHLGPETDPDIETLRKILQ